MMQLTKRVLGALALFSVIAAAHVATAAELETGLLGGYQGGPSGQAIVQVADFAEGLPLSLRFGVAYASLDPGISEDARVIFINDATNGTPEQKGWFWSYRFDLVYPLHLSSLEKVHVFAGPRYSQFTGNFKFIGGNEDFDVTSDQWGVGIGAGTSFDMGARMGLVFSGGVDYFFDSTLKGHDTSYSPDGEIVNGRHEFTFGDADEAINQPGLEFMMMIGVTYRFGR